MSYTQLPFTHATNYTPINQTIPISNYVTTIFKASLCSTNLLGQLAMHPAVHAATPTDFSCICHLCQPTKGSGGSTNWSDSSGIDRGGNLDADPLFVGPENPSFFPSTAGDYQLMASSPAVNTVGDYIFSSSDLAGNLRLQSNATDMGAYELPYYTLSLNLPDSANGTVTGTPQPCADNCSHSYPNGTVITLTTIADEDYPFTGWSGDCSGLIHCVVTMDANKSVGATFATEFSLFLPLVRR